VIRRALNSKAVSETNNQILPALAFSQSSKAENGVSRVNETSFAAVSWKMMVKEKHSACHTPNFKKMLDRNKFP